MGAGSYIFRCLCGIRWATDAFHSGKLFRCPTCSQFVILPLEHEGDASLPVFTFSTARLSLQPATSQDWRAMHAIQGDPRNYRYEVAAPNTERETRKRIRDSRFPSRFAKSNILLLQLREIESRTLIGSLAVTFRPPYYIAELGIMIGHDFQGRGYGTEAVIAVRDFLFGTLAVEKIHALTDSHNLPCQTILRKAGFRQEGFHQRFCYHRERGWLDALSFAILRLNDASSETSPLHSKPSHALSSDTEY